MGDEPAAPDMRWTRLPWHWEELPARGWPANWDCSYIDQRCFGFYGNAGVWPSPSHHASSASTTGLGARAAATELSCATWSVAASWISCPTANEQPSSTGYAFIPALRSSAATAIQPTPRPCDRRLRRPFKCRSLASTAQLQRDAKEIPSPLG